MQKLNMVDADTLLYQPLDKPRFVVDGLIPTGLILFLSLIHISEPTRPY